MIAVLLVDDSPLDRRLFKALLVEGVPPFLRDANLFMSPNVLPDPTDYRRFDGVILDRWIGHVDGIEEAKRIAAHNVGMPLMLISGVLPDMTPEDRALFVAVADKNDTFAALQGVRELARRTAKHERT